MILPRDSFGAALGILRKSASADALNVLVLCACDADSLCCLHILTVRLSLSPLHNQIRRHIVHITYTTPLPLPPRRCCRRSA